MRVCVVTCPCVRDCVRLSPGGVDTDSDGFLTQPDMLAFTTALCTVVCGGFLDGTDPGGSPDTLARHLAEDHFLDADTRGVGALSLKVRCVCTCGCVRVCACVCACVYV